MSDDISISVQNLGKAYRIWEDPSARLAAPLLETAAGLLPGNAGHAAFRRMKPAFADVL